jgi:hypothetical protein
MARRPLDERFIRKLSRHPHGTMFVSIPKEFIDALKWKGKQKVIFKKSGKRLIIEDWKE